MFYIIKKSKKTKARVSELWTPHGKILGPFFMPIATRGSVKNITSHELHDMKVPIVLSNTYHLMVRPGTHIIKKMKGLHTFMGWDGPILTDSGGYQVFSLAKLRKINSQGVEFREPMSGKKFFLTPEKSIQMQCILGSDILMVLDECPAYPCTKSYAHTSLLLTLRWAKRSKKQFSRIWDFSKKKRPLLFGIVQGSIYKDLRILSAHETTKIDFDGYAIGGVAVGEPRENMKDILQWIVKELPEQKPRYLMGLGRPDEIVHAVSLGIDMFDCVIPTREARHGRVYIFRQKKTFDLSKNSFYSTLNINNNKYSQNAHPLDKFCSCYTCKNFHASYLHHLYKNKDPLAMRLLTIHNVTFYIKLMEKIRISIKLGKM